MTWWRRRSRREAEQARRRIENAQALAAAAEVQGRAVDRIVDQSRTVTERLRDEVDKNHWTELLQNAWGAR